jgi:subtilisin-like proprotein convertase family protein
MKTALRRRIAMFSVGAIAALAMALPAGAGAAVVTLSNDAGIEFAALDPDPHPGDPYPSTVTGPAGTVNDVNVSVSQSHANPDDLDVSLVSPNGTAVFIQSDACELDANVFHPLSFDDAGAQFLSNAGNCPSAQNPYMVSNYDGGDSPDVYSAPGPVAPPQNALSFFNGGPSGGTWSLFTMDDTMGNGGNITGWSITLDYTPTPPGQPPPTNPTPPTTPTTPAAPVCKKKKKKKKKAAAAACPKKKKKKKK